MFASLLLLLASVSIVTGAEQGSEKFWVLPAGGESPEKEGEGESAQRERWQLCPMFKHS